MRVLFITPFYEPAWSMGGMARSGAAWARAVQRAGDSVNVFTTNANGTAELQVDTDSYVIRNGVKVKYFPRIRASGNRFFSIPLFRACVDNICRDNYDIVHLVGMWTFPALIGAITCLMRKVPYVVSLHGTLMPWALSRHGVRKRVFLKFIEKWRLEHASGIICSSELEKIRFEEHGIAVKDIRVIANCVSVDVVEREIARQFLYEKLGISREPLLIFSGRLVRNKGFHLTIEAIAQLQRKGRRVHFLIVGPEEDESARQAKRQIADMGLSSQVHFLGLLDGVPYYRAISGADLFVLNSYSENFGMAPAEALALGIPVLLSPEVGIADMVTRYGAGCVVSLDVNEIASGISRMLDMGEDLRSMGARGVRMIRENCSPEVVGQALVEYFREIIQDHR